MAAFINHTAIYNRHCIVTRGKMLSRACKRLKLLSAL